MRDMLLFASLIPLSSALMWRLRARNKVVYFDR
jgi:hypothetical protein